MEVVRRQLEEAESELDRTTELLERIEEDHRELRREVRNAYGWVEAAKDLIDPDSGQRDRVMDAVADVEVADEDDDFIDILREEGLEGDELKVGVAVRYGVEGFRGLEPQSDNWDAVTAVNRKGTDMKREKREEKFEQLDPHPKYRKQELEMRRQNTVFGVAYTFAATLAADDYDTGADDRPLSITAITDAGRVEDWTTDLPEEGSDSPLYEEVVAFVENEKIAAVKIDGYTVTKTPVPGSSSRVHELVAEEDPEDAGEEMAGIIMDAIKAGIERGKEEERYGDEQDHVIAIYREDGDRTELAMTVNRRREKAPEVWLPNGERYDAPTDFLASDTYTSGTWREIGGEVLQAAELG